MIMDRPADLASFATNLISGGRIVFSRDEAAKELGISTGALLDAAERLQRRQYIARLRQGFYIVVPPQYLSWGAPPPSWYIDDLMHHEGRPYYVGLLKAAELHGASHQAVMEFQVVTDKRLPRLRAGRSLLTFHFRKDMAAIAAGIDAHKTDTGTMYVSGVELTALDLLRYPGAAGGVDAIATVLADLAPKINAERLAALGRACERSVIQRLGFLLDRLGHQDRAAELHGSLATNPKTPPWVELERKSEAANKAVPALERNERWHVIVHKYPEVDE
jgi:predicted transcriptional regulator of viral defense system